MERFNESPVVYYSEGETSFLFKRAQVILKADCLVEITASKEKTANEDNWYLAGTDGETLPDIDDSQWEEGTELEHLNLTESQTI